MIFINFVHVPLLPLSEYKMKAYLFNKEKYKSCMVFIFIFFMMGEGVRKSVGVMMSEARAAFESHTGVRLRDPSLKPPHQCLLSFLGFPFIFLLLYSSLEALYCSELPWISPEPSSFSLHFSSLYLQWRQTTF